MGPRPVEQLRLALQLLDFLKENPVEVVLLGHASRLIIIMPSNRKRSPKDGAPIQLPKATCTGLYYGA